MSKRSSRRNRSFNSRGGSPANRSSNKQIQATKKEVDVASLQEYEATVSGTTPPKVQIDPIATMLSQAIVKEAKDEIAWYLKLKETPTGWLIYGEPLIPFQTVSSTSVEIESEQAGALLEEIDDSGELPEDYRVHAHSHVNMNSSPSATDDHHWGQFNETYGGQACVRLILNKRNEMYAEIKVPVKDTSVMLSFVVDVTIYHPFIEKLDKQLKTKITEKPFYPVKHGNPTYDWGGRYTGDHVTHYSRVEQDAHPYPIAASVVNPANSKKEDEMEEALAQVEQSDALFKREQEESPNGLLDGTFFENAGVDPEKAAQEISEWLQDNLDLLTMNQEFEYLNSVIAEIQSRLDVERLQLTFEVLAELDKYKTYNVATVDYSTEMAEVFCQMAINYEENFGI